VIHVPIFRATYYSDKKCDQREHDQQTCKKISSWQKAPNSSVHPKGVRNLENTRKELCQKRPRAANLRQTPVCGGAQEKAHRGEREK
jgi:hypothetical protein